MNESRQLKARIAAIDTSYGEAVATELLPLHIVRIVGTVRQSGLVDIICNGRNYSVFHADLIARSEAVKAAAE